MKKDSVLNNRYRVDEGYLNPANKVLISERTVLSSGANFAYSALFLIAFYYLAYRYPFQIGDENTSPTYGPTPVVIQVAKYVTLSGTIFLILNVQSLKFRTSNLLTPLITIFAVFSLLICIIFAPVNFGATTRFFEIGFTMIFAILIASANSRLAINRKFIKILTIFFWFNVIVYIVQLLLFFLIGRLPALGYEGGNVRFGGVWDDPNSAIIPFLLYTVYCMFRDGKTWRNGILLIISLIALILSQSVTTVVATIVTAVVIYFWFWRGVPSSAKLMNAAIVSVVSVLGGGILFLFVSALPVFDLSSLFESFEKFVEIKEGSAATRGSTYAVLFDLDFLTLLGLDPLMEGGENSYVNILVNFGVIFLVVFIAIQALTIRSLYIWTRNAVSKEDYSTAMAFSAFYIWYVFAMLNLPLAEVFPDNLIAAIISGAAIAASGRSVRRLASPRNLDIHTYARRSGRLAGGNP
ncbi:MAG: hypothetical protein MK060_15830 [Blastomonas sp.]|uniref:hypothetical protein n=1 Tax=Blastomonas sp. TaxID=1909299 RepID=UPI00406A9E1B|nr:hypothetical protein [Blastomonas sp.]